MVQSPVKKKIKARVPQTVCDIVWSQQSHPRLDASILPEPTSFPIPFYLNSYSRKRLCDGTTGFQFTRKGGSWLYLRDLRTKPVCSTLRWARTARGHVLSQALNLASLSRKKWHFEVYGKTFLEEVQKAVFRCPLLIWAEETCEGLGTPVLQ